MHAQSRWFASAKMNLRRLAGHHRWLFACDRLLFAVLPIRRGQGECSLLIAPPGAGNIGDQAMVEAFLENTPGPVVIVVRDAGDVSVPPTERERTTVVVLPGLVYGALPFRLTDVARFRGLLRRARSVSVVGADIMDGCYNPNASANRANLAYLACKQGLDVNVLGFSWNVVAHEDALAAIKRAAAAGVRLLLRDPLSASRLHDSGVTQLVETADTVFAAKTIDHGAAATLLEDIGQMPFALVNASGLTERKFGQLHEYRTVVTGLIERGLRVILIPHVSRPGGDDMVICRAIADAVDDPRVTLVDRLLPPATIRAVASKATLTVTGRMHLSIMSLYSATPAITLASHGKVEGLMQLFGCDYLCIEPAPGFGLEVLRVADTLLGHHDEIQEMLQERLPHVVRRAGLNFSEAPPAGDSPYALGLAKPLRASQ